MSDSPKTEPQKNRLPAWGKAELPEPKPLSWRNWTGFVGPGLVMCGIQLAGGEWLVGAEITARYGGGLMWIAAVAIICQVFYNMECGRYALFCGEPVFTGMMRSRPGPRFWMGVFLLLSLGMFIPALSTQGAAVIASIIQGQPAGEADRTLVITLAYVLLGLVTLPILLGGKIFNMMQVVFTAKVVIVLGFCLIVGVFFVSADNWGKVFGGFFKVGNVPVVLAEDKNNNGVLDAGEDFDRDGKLDVVEKYKLNKRGAVVKPKPEDDKDGDGFHDTEGWGYHDADGDGRWDGENVANIFTFRGEHGHWPIFFMAQIALLGAFAGYAGGGGLGNATYGNFVRDKGWGMGSAVGAIPSAIGGRKITLSHIGKTFDVNDENVRRWNGWWRYIRTDQLFIWMPGCFMGMALPALISLQFSPHSPMFDDPNRLDWAQAIISADGMRHAFTPGTGLSTFFWVSTLLVGLVVLLPSQMSIVEDVCRRWTDILWSGSQTVREKMRPDQVRRIYYSILAIYILWTFVCATIFLFYSKPKIMVLIVANLNTIGIGFTAFLILRMNCRLLPVQLRPRWYHRMGMIGCGIFYLGMASIVFFQTQVPLIRELFF